MRIPRLSKTTWGLGVSALFSLALTITPIPETWRPTAVWLTWILLMLMCLGWVIAHWNPASKFRLQMGARPLTLLIVGIVGAAMSVGIWLLARPEVQAKHTAQAKVLLTVSQWALPINLTPQSVGYMLELNPRRDDEYGKRWLGIFRNTGKKDIEWPEKVNVGKGASLDPIYVYEFTNHNKETLLDVSISIPTRFFKPIVVPNKVTKKKDGNWNVELDTKAVGIKKGFMAMREAKRGSIPPVWEVFYPGEIVKAIERTAIIPAISPGETVKVYVVNQSPLVAVAWFPQEASAITEQSNERTPINLVAPDTGPLSTLGYVTLAPSAYQWKGVPGYE